MFVHLQGLLVVSWWQHHSVLGTRGQRHPSQGDSDADALPSGDPRSQSLQCRRLQTALAEKRGLSVCESWQDSQRNTGTHRKRTNSLYVTDFFKKKKKKIISWLFLPSQGVVTNFEIFRMREKQVPVDVVEMKGKTCICTNTEMSCK